MGSTQLEGMGRLARLMARRDRVRLAIWVLGLTGAITVSAVSLLDVYPTQSAIEGYVRAFGDNPALVVFAGPGYGFDDPNIGVVLVNETQLWGMVGVALMSIFLVVRHTRTEEDSERSELLRSLVVGRHASIAAATAVVTLAQVAVAALTALAFVALGYPVAGSMALAGSFLAVGVVMVGVAAVMAQVSGSTRGALGLSSVVLLLAFVVRAIGDVGAAWLTWCSPLGWAQAVRAYAGERWWVLALCLVVAVGLELLAFGVSTRRDLGAGLLVRPTGHAGAPGWMTHPFGLAVRLARGMVIGWMVGLFATGAVFGAIADDIEQMLADNPQMADFFAQLEGVSLTDAYLSTVMTMLGVIAAGLAVALALVPHGEEVAGRASWVLSLPVTRGRWLGAHLAVAATATVVAIGSAGLGVGVAYASVTGDAGQFPRLIAAALVQVPAALVLAAVAIAVFGLMPRRSLLGWIPLVVTALVVFLGEVLQLPQWARDVSPFEHVPAVIVTGFETLPTVALLAVAAGFAGLGWWGGARRDIAT